jgi:4-aminobutyrate aminotransferase-like enzyme
VTHVPSYNCDLLDGDGAERAEIVEHMIRYASGDVAAFVAEPMFGTAGNIPAPEGYFERVKEICDDHGVLFVADEVITGFGRTGERFGIEHYDVEPDIVTTAKALGGGMAIGATLATEEVATTFESMDYFSTFGGNPVACAAGLASVDVMEREGLPGRARELGAHALDRLHEMQADHGVVGEVRGRGLLIGVDLVDEGGDPLPKEYSVALREMALERGLVLPAGQGWRGNTIRISPPLVITREQLDRGLDVLDECLGAMG